MATNTHHYSPIFSTFRSPISKCNLYNPPNTLFFPNLFTTQNPRLRISLKTTACSSKRCSWIHNCCGDVNTGIATDDSSKEASVNIQLPRRSLLVQFTCDACGGSTKRLINRLAYERGTVFVQCSGCLQHHKLVDNLGLVVEYDFRNEVDEDTAHT